MASMHVVIAGAGGPIADQGPSSMSRSTPSNPFDVAKPMRFWTNCARFASLQAVPQLLLPSPPIWTSALIACECAAATHCGTLTFEMLLVSRFGPCSVARLNKSIWVRSFHGMFEEGAQPTSTVTTSFPEGGGGVRLGTAAVELDIADEEPIEFVAVTFDRSLRPASAAATVYDELVAFGIAVQFAPELSHDCQRYEKRSFV